jgi:hypothetical protein
MANRFAVFKAISFVSMPAAEEFSRLLPLAAQGRIDQQLHAGGQRQAPPAVGSLMLSAKDESILSLTIPYRRPATAESILVTAAHEDTDDKQQCPNSHDMPEPNPAPVPAGRCWRCFRSLLVKGVPMCREDPSRSTRPTPPLVPILCILREMNPAPATAAPRKMCHRLISTLPIEKGSIFRVEPLACRSPSDKPRDYAFNSVERKTLSMLGQRPKASSSPAPTPHGGPHVCRRLCLSEIERLPP